MDKNRDWITLTDNALYVGFMRLGADKKDILTRVYAKLAQQINNNNLLMISEHEWTCYIKTCNHLFESEQKEYEGYQKGRPIDSTRKLTAFELALYEAEVLIDSATEVAIPPSVNK